MGNYFVRIDDAHELRRKILESSKGSIHMLKGYQQLLRVRGEKMAAMHGLRRELKEITVLLNRVEELLPTLTAEELARMRGEAVAKPSARSAKKAPKKGKKELPALDDGKAVYVGLPGRHPKHRRVVVPDVPEVVPAEPEEPADPLAHLDDQLSDIERRLKGL